VQETVDAIDRQLRALELRKAGATYDMIAGALGYAHRSGAAQAVQAALKAVVREPAEEVRTLELERLDAMLMALWPAVRNGNFGASAQALRIMERRAKLLGLDRTVVSGVLDIDMTALTDEQLQRLADGEDPVAVLAGTGIRRD
jgi:hypothetical protein